MNDTNKKAEFKEWSASSWKNLKISQQPVYKDLQLLDDIKAKVIRKIKILIFEIYFTSIRFRHCLLS